MGRNRRIEEDTKIANLHSTFKGSPTSERENTEGKSDSNVHVVRKSNFPSTFLGTKGGTKVTWKTKVLGWHMQRLEEASAEKLENKTAHPQCLSTVIRGAEGEKGKRVEVT